MISVHDFLVAVNKAWEGLYSDDPLDPGNWSGGLAGVGTLLGSMHGVTPLVLAKHRGVDVSTLTAEDMQSVTLNEAADIGESMFYKAPHFDLLTWCPATAILLDFGWGSGAGQAAMSMQRLVGTTADGVVGPITAKAYNDWLGSGVDPAQAMYTMRMDFYRMICQTNPTLQKYFQGWKNRADWVLRTAV